ncbi:MAG: hypothetical protein JWM53_1662, partial [bacterium]|nr:hypothetical protein [bacterium]
MSLESQAGDRAMGRARSTTTSLPATVKVNGGSGLVAGPLTTLPSAANSLPWQAQMKAAPVVASPP